MISATPVYELGENKAGVPNIFPLKTVVTLPTSWPEEKLGFSVNHQESNLHSLQFPSYFSRNKDLKLLMVQTVWKELGRFQKGIDKCFVSRLLGIQVEAQPLQLHNFWQ